MDQERSMIGETDRAVYQGHNLKPLPATREEVEGIKKLLKNPHPAVYLGAAAREEELKACRHPTILHLATHGFFFENVALPTNLTLQTMLGLNDNRGGPVIRGNPMHRSGLALAGANLALKGLPPAEGRDDGLVTAEEVGGLDLWGTDLVTLSACETARGQTQAGEGVMGLRRAFVQAGARNLLLTMWNVEDKTTRDLMLAFYADYLKTGDAIGAMTRAQRAALAEARKQNKTLHPRFWAPFLISIQGAPSPAK
jgi:CHAT domain-containing protein